MVLMVVWTSYAQSMYADTIVYSIGVCVSFSQRYMRISVSWMRTRRRPASCWGVAPCNNSPPSSIPFSTS
eukprot:3931457-Prymnesium_polylepis.1